MKQYFSFIAIIIFFQNNNSFGQDFAPIGAEWYYSSSAGGLAPTGSEYYHLVARKDTSINNFILRIIDRTYYRYQGDSITLAPYYIYQTEDTVFLYNIDLNKFLRLLIFNPNQGDTLTFDIPYVNNTLEDSTFRAVIDTIVTETYNEVELKKYVLEQIDEFGWFCGYYLEKVGGYEWFLPLGKAIIPEADGPVRCYHDNEIKINFTSRACDYRRVSSINSQFYDNFSIFPNPTSGKVTIKSEVKIELIEIIDSSGKTILKTNKPTFDLTEFTNGIYYINIHSNQNSILKKIIKN